MTTVTTTTTLKECSKEEILELIGEHEDNVERVFTDGQDVFVIVPDDSCDWDFIRESFSEMNFNTFIRGYGSLHDSGYGSLSDLLDNLLWEGVVDELKPKHDSTTDLFNDIISRLDKKGIIAFPIAATLHGSIHYYRGTTFDRWDGGIAGLAWREKENIRKLFGYSRITAKVRKELEQFVDDGLEYFTNAANGYVYRWKQYSLQEDGEYEIVDSCWGYVGEKDKDIIDVDVSIAENLVEIAD